MHERLSVHRFQPSADIQRKIDCAANRQRSGLAQQTAQVFAAQEVHDEVRSAVRCLATIEHSNHVFIVNPRNRLYLTTEALLGDQATARAQQLHRELSPYTKMLRSVYVAHSAGANSFQESVGISQHLALSRCGNLFAACSKRHGLSPAMSRG
ncbi:MAG: hypothetical protein ABI627_31015 [Polyangiaceae bacterium]